MATIYLPYLECDPGAINIFNAGDTYVIEGMPTAGWNGSPGNLIDFKSSVLRGTVYFDITAIGDFYATYCRFSDITVTGGTIYANDGSSINGGNIVGIVCPRSVIAPSNVHTTYKVVSGGLSITSPAADVEQVEFNIAEDTSNEISILEKAQRLTDLQDPDLIDIKDIQHLAANMGYNLEVHRDEAGELVDVDLETSVTDSERYLRFMTGNLPNIYKRKATDESFQIMLYSFGLIGDIVKYYTENYLPPTSGGLWQLDLEKDLSKISETYYTTPHFALVISVDDNADLLIDSTKRSAVVRAVNSLRPINTVFRSLTGEVKRHININVRMRTRITRFLRVKTDKHYSVVGGDITLFDPSIVIENDSIIQYS